MKQIKCSAVVFDLDGVLIDSKMSIERCWRSWAGKKGLDPAPFLRVAHGRQTADTIRLVAPELDAEAEAAKLAREEAKVPTGVSAMTGAHELLKSLPSERWGVVTSGSGRVAEARLGQAGLPVPAVLVCAEDVTHGKPDPEGYVTGATRLGVAGWECAAVEDSPPGIESARAASMRTIAVSTTHRCEELEEAEAEICLDGVHEIRAVADSKGVLLHLERRVGPAG